MVWEESIGGVACWETTMVICSGFGLGENQVVWVVVGRVQDGIMTQKATKLDVCATAQHSAATHCTLLLLCMQLVISASCRVMQ